MKTLLFLISASVANILLGSATIEQWKVIYILGFVGAIAYKFTSFRRTGRTSAHSPQSFNIQYWLSDRGNWNDLILGLLLFHTIALFKNEVVAVFPNNPYVIAITPFVSTPFFYVAVGFLMTLIIKKLRSWIKGEKK